MITITLGTIPFSFDRAINWLDSLLQKEIITEDVYVQHGTTDVSVLAKYPYVTTVSIVETSILMEQIDNSRLVISHAGQGLTRALAARGTSFILLPRLAQYKEHIDDHQLWFAQGVEKMGIPLCQSFEDFEDLILHPPKPFKGKLFDGPKLAEHLLQTYPV